MHILLVALQVAFFMPVVGRALGLRGDSQGIGVAREFLAGFRRPALVVHALGVLVLWAGLTAALAGGRVEEVVTVQGVLGAALILGGALLMTWSVVVFRSWRLLPTIGAKHELCTSGPFRFVRHPIYLSLDLLGVGSALWVGSPVMILGAGLIVLGGDWRARIEEKALLEAFGDRYRSYMRQTRRTVPYLY